MVCQWDGGFDPNTLQGGGCFIVLGVKTHHDEFKPIIELSCWFHDVEDAVTAQMWICFCNDSADQEHGKQLEDIWSGQHPRQLNQSGEIVFKC